MRFSRARYVTLCQQSLVTAAVLAVGVSAAGVKTLDIVPQPGSSAGTTGAQALAPTPARSLDAVAPLRERPEPAPVDVAPVTPKVREIEVAGVEAAAPAKPAPEAPREEARRAPAASLVALSKPTDVKGYATVGVTWKQGVDYDEDQIKVSVRTETNGRWSGWAAAEYHDDHAPDAASADEGASTRPGTDALVIGDVDRVQMRAETTDGRTPPDLRLAVIDPGAGAMDKAEPAIDTAALPAPDSARSAPQAAAETAADAEDSADGDAEDTATLSAMKTAPKPYIYSRAQWGANEKLRESGNPGYGTIKAGFIHHTVNTNSYTASQVPALMRGIYAYHTQSRGWRDIGYNFIVDRFGRIWEGRFGGVSKAVVGAHTLGYNEYSFAMSALGNFDVANPPAKMLDAYASLFAWKLSMYNVRADNPKVYVKNKYFKAISGHRDAGSTACPGRYLYAKLPSIRTAAAKIQDKAQSTAPAPAPKPDPTPAPDPKPTTPPASATFSTPTQRARAAVKQPTNITFPRSLNLAGDTNPDLVLRAASGAVTVLPTGGMTGYRSVGSTPGKWTRFDLVAAVGDVTGDGRGDVVARLAADKVTRVYTGDGAGHFAVPGKFATSAFKNADVLSSAGDWNKDGRSDLLMRNPASGWVTMVPGKGAGKFGTPVLLSKEGKRFRQIAVVADMSGDGRSELVGLQPNGYLYVARGTSAGKLQAFTKSRKLGTGYDLAGAARDLTGDGIGDLVIQARSGGALKILVGERSGGFGRALGPFAAGAGLGRITAGQAVGSAHPDVVGVNKAGTALVTLEHNGLTNLKPMLKHNLSRTDIVKVYNVGDWNGDGKGDVITRQTSGDALVFRPGNGDGTFGAGSHMSKGGGWKSFTYLAAVGDITGDGDPDLVGKTNTGLATIFPGNGSKGFEGPIRTPWDVRSFNQIGSGVWKTRSFFQSAFISSDGNFVPSLASGAGTLKGYSWVIGPGDLDGDGHGDLVGRDASGQLWLLPGTSSGLGPRRFIAAGFAGYKAAG